MFRLEKKASLKKYFKTVFTENITDQGKSQESVLCGLICQAITFVPLKIICI